MKYLYNETKDFIYTRRQNTKTFARKDETIFDIAKQRVNECKTSGVSLTSTQQKTHIKNWIKKDEVDLAQS